MQSACNRAKWAHPFDSNAPSMEAQAHTSCNRRAIMTATKKVCHVIRFCILFLFLFLSLTTGTGKGDTPKGILLREGNGPRAPLLIRGSKASPSEGFNSRLRALGLRAHYWSEVRRPAPWKGSTATSGHSGSAPTTEQGFVGWPSKGSQPPQTQSEG
jgi:hypothetical protein